MKTRIVDVNGVKFGGEAPFVLIAGPCVIEDRASTIKMAGEIVKITKKLKIPYVFKASYDKANRTSVNAERGMGLDAAMKIFETQGFTLIEQTTDG